MLGFAHVVSLREVLDQIKIAFGTDRVYFPRRPSIPASSQLLSSDGDLLIQAPQSQRQSGFHVSNWQKFPSQQTLAQPEHTISLNVQNLKQAGQADWAQLAQKLEHAEQRKQLRQLHLHQIQQLQLQQAQQLQKLEEDQKFQLLFPQAQIQPVAGLSRQAFASLCDTETTTDAYNPGRTPLEAPSNFPMSPPQGVDSAAQSPGDPEEVSTSGPLFSDPVSLGNVDARLLNRVWQSDPAPECNL